jgi:type IV secretion system protein VirB10
MTGTYKSLAHRVLGLLASTALVIGSVIPAAAQTRRTTRRAPRLGTYSRPAGTLDHNYYTVGAGTTIRVRMDQQISSETARTGDTFTTTVVDPVYAGGVEVIPAASKITGRVTSVNRAERRQAGSIAVVFDSLRLPNGMTRAINGSLTDISTEDSRSDNEGSVRGGSTTKRDVVFIGGGATTGALIGAIAGGGKGAGIGAGVGAGIGVAGALLSKGKEAVVKRDTEFGVVLNRSLSLPAFRQNY